MNVGPGRKKWANNGGSVLAAARGHPGVYFTVELEYLRGRIRVYIGITRMGQHMPTGHQFVES